MNSYGNGIMMMGDMPMLTGTWYNPKTGDSFTVRDCYIEDNGIKVMTTDGRMLDYNIIQNYVQSDKPIPKMTKQEPLKKKIAKPVAPKVNVTAGLETSKNTSVDDILTDEDKAILGMTTEDDLNEPYVPATKTTVTTSKQKVEIINVDIKNADIIAKGLKKAEKPTIDVKLLWTAFPEKELNALTDIMDVPVEDIVAWMTEEYFKFDDLKKSIGEYIKNVIENGYVLDERFQSVDVKDNSENDKISAELNKSKDELKALKEELKKSRDEIKALKCELKNAKAEIKQLSKTVKK